MQKGINFNERVRLCLVNYCLFYFSIFQFSLNLSPCSLSSICFLLLSISCILHQFSIRVFSSHILKHKTNGRYTEDIKSFANQILFHTHLLFTADLPTSTSFCLQLDCCCSPKSSQICLNLSLHMVIGNRQPHPNSAPLSPFCPCPLPPDPYVTGIVVPLMRSPSMFSTASTWISQLRSLQAAMESRRCHFSCSCMSGSRAQYMITTT